MKNKLPRNYLVALTLITAFCLITLLIRNLYEQNSTYNFLLWNLFLAFVPLALAWLTYFFVGRANTVIIIIFSLVWLLFYPNSPYMISDLIHVNSSSTIVLYDTLILFLFAMLALFYGFYSLKIIHLVYKKITGTKIAHIVILMAIVLSSAGIYLGRILRLNSWDLFTHPFRIMQIVLDHLFPITKNPTTYILIFLFSAIQFILLVMMKDLDEIEKHRLISSEYARRQQLT
ncbi:MAG: DUF1361 domain-containing protein [Flavisolibacter sp.]|nr:DUF1361 domain-containing protein [Flavisolibacter sp.]